MGSSGRRIRYSASEIPIYDEAGVAPGDVFRELVVRRRTQEAPDTVSFVFGSPDGQPLPKDGQVSASPSASGSARRAPAAADGHLLSDLGLPEAMLVRWYEDLGPRPARADLIEGLVSLDGIDLPADADVYLCGPVPFMAAVKTALVDRGVPSEQIRYEIFGPDRELAAA